jgi:hypothetical protein
LSSGPFAWERDRISLHIVLPHWLFAIAAMMTGAAPWIRWRYSLRMLLIGTTLVAITLGLIVLLR